MERDLEEDALTAANRWRVLLRVTLRRSAAAIGAAALWVGLQTATEITITDMMQVRTYAEEVYTQMVAPEADAVGRLARRHGGSGRGGVGAVDPWGCGVGRGHGRPLGAQPAAARDRVRSAFAVSAGKGALAALRFRGRRRAPSCWPCRSAAWSGARAWRARRRLVGGGDVGAIWR